jgi:hypothetical protein
MKTFKFYIDINYKSYCIKAVREEGMIKFSPDFCTKEFSFSTEEVRDALLNGKSLSVDWRRGITYKVKPVSNTTPATRFSFSKKWLPATINRDHAGALCLLAE